MKQTGHSHHPVSPLAVMVNNKAQPRPSSGLLPHVCGVGDNSPGDRLATARTWTLWQLSTTLSVCPHRMVSVQSAHFPPKVGSCSPPTEARWVGLGVQFLDILEITDLLIYSPIHSSTQLGHILQTTQCARSLVLRELRGKAYHMHTYAHF